MLCGIFGLNIHNPEPVIKMKATLGAKIFYRDTQLAIKKFNLNKRSINNHVKITEATNTFGREDFQRDKNYKK